MRESRGRGADVDGGLFGLWLLGFCGWLPGPANCADDEADVVFWLFWLLVPGAAVPAVPEDEAMVCCVFGTVEEPLVFCDAWEGPAAEEDGMPFVCGCDVVAMMAVGDVG